MMKAEKLESLMVEMLVGAAGGKPARWAHAVGTVEVLPITLNPKSNWRVIARGSADDKAAVELAAELVRAEHPYAEA